jgi:hypothetical protein
VAEDRCFLISSVRQFFSDAKKEEPMLSWSVELPAIRDSKSPEVIFFRSVPSFYIQHSRF